MYDEKYYKCDLCESMIPKEELLTVPMNLLAATS
jgi:hypothetical protein